MRRNRRNSFATCAGGIATEEGSSPSTGAGARAAAPGAGSKGKPGYCHSRRRRATVALSAALRASPRLAGPSPTHWRRGAIQRRHMQVEASGRLKGSQASGGGAVPGGTCRQGQVRRPQIRREGLQPVRAGQPHRGLTLHARVSAVATTPGQQAPPAFHSVCRKSDALRLLAADGTPWAKGTQSRL